MAPALASADIAALVAAFPPPDPGRDHPSLVRGYSGNTLLNSGKVLVQFEALMKDRSTRIKVRELPALLGIRDTSWLLGCYEGALHINRDKQFIITAREIQTLLSQLASDAGLAFIELSSFAEKHDVAFESLREATLQNQALHHFHDSVSHGCIISSLDHVESTKRDILQALSSAESEKVNLTQQLPAVPTYVIRDLIGSIRNEVANIQGDVQESATGVLFVPGSYEVAQAEKQKQAHVLVVQQLVKALENEGSCILLGKSEDERHNLFDDVCVEFSKQVPPPGSKIELLEVGDEQEFLVLQPVLSKIKDELKKNVRTLADSNDLPSDPVIDSKMEAKLIQQSFKPELAGLLLRSLHREEVKSSLYNTVLEIQRAKFFELEKIFQETLAAPLKLYALGIAEDATLKQHQEDYLTEHFRAEAVVRFADDARSKAATTFPKIRVKDLEKLVQQCSPVKTMSDVQAAVSKFAKKQELSEPHDTQLERVKKETLQQKVKAMQKMTRASDVLQNLIWILLAQKSAGLFMTAGKDTSRIIKQYRLMGDDAVASRLESWRDKLKAGQQSREDIHEMRELAIRVVKGMYGVEASAAG